MANTCVTPAGIDTVPVAVTVCCNVRLLGTEIAPHDALVPSVVRYFPDSPVCDGKDSTAPHSKPVEADAFTFRTCPSVLPTGRRAGVLSAVAVMMSPLASTRELATAPTSDAEGIAWT